MLSSIIMLPCYAHVLDYEAASNPNGSIITNTLACSLMEYKANNVGSLISLILVTFLKKYLWSSNTLHSSMYKLSTKTVCMCSYATVHCYSP